LEAQLYIFGGPEKVEDKLGGESDCRNILRVSDRDKVLKTGTNVKIIENSI
jgi:hypothetical protein